MKSAPRRKGTSVAEVTNVSAHGFWLLVAGRELFVPFESFPWFADEPIRKLVNVELHHGDHLHWPDLDVDLSIECIEHPERFPLISRSAGTQPARKRGSKRASTARRRSGQG